MTICGNCKHFRPDKGYCAIKLLADTDPKVEPGDEACPEWEGEYPWRVGDKLYPEGGKVE